MKKKVNTRPLQADDIPAVIALQQRVYPTIPPWKPARLRAQLDMSHQGQVVAESDGALVG